MNFAILLRHLPVPKLKKFIAVGTLFVVAILIGILFSFVIRKHTPPPVEKATSEARKKFFLECVEAWRSLGYNPSYVNSACREAVDIHENL
jgi:hypothetical protein